MPVTDSKPTSDNPQTKAPQNVQYAAPYQQQLEDDTIDLYELWNTLWNKKWLVIAVTVIAALGSVVFALLQPPIYKAEALLLPPSAKNIQSLNLQSVQEGEQGRLARRAEKVSKECMDGEQEVDVCKAFTTFKNNLSSRSLQKKFIDEQGLMDILAPGRTLEMRDIEIFESFANMIKIEHIKGALKNVTGISASMESGDPEFAAKLINDYVSFFDLETIRALVAAARYNIEQKITDIEYKISSKRQMAKLRREDQIKRYEEAAEIAVKLGVRDRVDTTNVVQNNQLNISKSSTPLYYRGYRALNVEINILKNVNQTILLLKDYVIYRRNWRC